MEEPHTFYASWIQVVEDVFCQVVLYIGKGQTQAGPPFRGHPLDILGLQAVIAGALKDLGEIERWCSTYRRNSTCPKSKNKWFSGKSNPFFRKVIGDVLRSVDLKRGIANEQC